MKPSQLAEAINECLDMGEPFFVWGAPGVGKSKIIAQVVARRRMQLNDVRLSQMDSVDLRGFPSPDHAKRAMDWLPPSFLPRDKKTKGLIFFDELNSAPQASQAPCYQLFLDRRLGDYELPVGWNVGAAGNREGDRAIVHKMSSALANRLIHLELEVSAEDWKAHARKEGVEQKIVGYISFRENNLHHFDPNSKSQAFPTPRAWFKVDKIEKQRANKPRDVTRGLIRGTVGEAVAHDYEAYLESAANLPTVEEIRLAPKTAPIPQSAAAAHAVASMLVPHTNANTLEGFLHYVCRLAKEFQVVYMRDCVKNEPKVKTSSAWNGWCIENHEVMF